MNEKNERTQGDPIEPPAELDEGIAFAYGEDSVEPSSPSVIDQIGAVTGKKPRVSLRDEESDGASPLLTPLSPGDRREAGKYVVQGELGRGGVGTVHKGHDQDLGRDVAIKFLHERYKDEPSVLHRFVEEAQIGGQLQHPGIVPVYDLGLVDGKPFFSMKLVKGKTLAKKLMQRESPRQDLRSFLAIFEDVCQTLAYAHARGVVHRDLKPANIMIGAFGEVQVVDWGMGKVLKSGGVDDEKRAAERHETRSVIATTRSSGHGSQSVVGSVMGTPGYMPPEQARGDVEAMDERSDVFALGAILCEILTEQPPYVGGERDELICMAAMAKLDDAHARLGACDAEPELVELATRCLMPAPAARPASAEVVSKAVHDHLAAGEARVHEARVEAAEAKVRAAALKRTQTLGVGLTLVIAVGLLASLWFWREASTAAENERTANLKAQSSAREALESERLALKNEALAESRAEENRHLLYISDMQHASSLLDDEESSPIEIDRLLARWVPFEEEEDLRDFTWRYLWRQLHGDGRNSVVNDDYGIGFLPDGRLAIRRADRFVAVTPGDASSKTEHLWRIPNRWMTDSAVTHRSPDGSKLALQLPGHLVLVDVATGDELHRIQEYLRGFPPLFDSLGRWMCYFSSPTEFHVVDAGTGAILHERIPLGSPPPGGSGEQDVARSPAEVMRSTGPIRGAALSPDGARVLLAGIPQHNKITVYRIGSDEQPWSDLVAGSSIEPGAVAWSPRGDTVAAGSSKGLVGIWDSESGNRRHTISAHGNRISQVKYSRDGTRLATAAQNGIVAVWDVESGMQRRRFSGHADAVRSLAFSSDGRFLSSASSDGVVRFWDLEASKEDSLVLDYSSTPDLEIERQGGSLVLSSVGAALQQQPESPKNGDRVLAVHGRDDRDATSLEGLSVKEASLLLRGAHGSSFSLRLQDQDTSSTRDIEVARDLAGDRNAERCEFSPDGRWLAVAGNDTVIYDTETWRPSLYLDERSNGVAFSPDGHVVALESQTRSATEVRLYSIPDHRLLTTWPIGRGLSGLTFSPDGRYLAGGTGSPWFNGPPITSYVKIWNVELSEEVSPLIHQNTVTDIQFAPDGRHLVSTSKDGTVRLWNVEDWSPVWIVESPASSIAISPDGTRVVAGGANGSIRVLDLETGREVHRFQGHDHMVADLDFAPDSILASASWDTSVKLWNLDLGVELLTLQGHTTWVVGLSWSPDGARLCSSDFGGTVRHWDAPSLDQIGRLPAFMASMVRHSDALRERSPRQAQALLEETVADQEELLGARHRSTILSLRRLGELYLAQGDAARAADALVTTLERLEGVGSELSFSRNSSRLALAKAKLQLGATDEAESLLRTLITPSAWVAWNDQQDARIHLAEILRQRGRETDLEEAATLLTDFRDSLAVRRARIALYEQWGRPLELAQERARLAYDRSDRAGHKEHLHQVLELIPDDRETTWELGDQYALSRQWDKAAEFFLRWARLEAEALVGETDSSDPSSLHLARWERAGTAIACAGDRADYMGFCTRLLDLTEGMVDDGSLYRAARITMFMQTDEPVVSRSYDLARSVVSDSPEMLEHLTMALAEYRRGNFMAAIRQGRKFLQFRTTSWYFNAIVHSVMAGSYAHEAYDETDRRARRFLAQAQGLLGNGDWSNWQGAALTELIYEEVRTSVEESER